MANDDPKVQAKVEKAAKASAKVERVRATDSIKAERDRINGSDLGKAEKKAALASLKNVGAALKAAP